MTLQELNLSKEFSNKYGYAVCNDLFKRCISSLLTLTTLAGEILNSDMVTTVIKLTVRLCIRNTISLILQSKEPIVQSVTNCIKCKNVIDHDHLILFNPKNDTHYEQTVICNNCYISY